MAALQRVLKLRKQWRRGFNSSLNKLTTHPSPTAPATATGIHLQCRLTHRSYEHQISRMTSGGLCGKTVEEIPGVSSTLPSILAGAFGMGMLQLVHADSNEADAQDAQIPPSGYDNVEKLVKQERHRIEELIKSKGMQYGSYPLYTIAIKGQKVTIKFHVPPTCELSHLIVHLASHLGLKAGGHGSGSDMRLRAWDSAVAWQLTLNKVEENGVQGKELSQDKDDHEGDLCVLIFQSLINSDNAEIEFIKQGSFSSEELEALVSTLKLAGSKTLSKNKLDRRPRGSPERRENRTGSAQVPAEQSLAALEAMGVIVYGLGEQYANSSNGEVSWDTIAGYDSQKREIEDTVLLALHSPEVYDDIARSTRRKFESNRPRAVLFEGPPGTGKTSCARVIAHQAGVPLLYVPLEVVMSKYYGESERLLGKVFSLANELSDGAIIFLDEVDSFAVARDDGMHEATRRILSVLLRQIDGFEQDKRVVVIAATNRTEDLDPALISRFDSMITFGLPDRQNREEIAAQYAKHLKKPDLSEFAAVTEGMSGRDIRDVCQQAERRWASKIIRGQTRGGDSEQGHAPPVEEYLESALNRQKALLGISNKKSLKRQDPNLHDKKSPMDFD